MEKQFLPFGKVNEKRQVLAIDCHHPKAFALSHWRGAMPLSELSDDTTGGIVLNAIKAGISELDYPYVTNNHFDIDGFVGVWSACNPQRAIEYESVLREMALIGDFRELDLDKEGADTALKLVCWINAVEKEKFYRPFGYLEQEGHEAELCVDKYEYFLAVFEKVLLSPDDYVTAWGEEYLQVIEDYKLVKSAEVSVRQIPEIRLQIVKSPRKLHYYALFNSSEACDMVLSIYPENAYELEYKYTTWVDTAHRWAFPRIDLQPLADRLNDKEESDLRWLCEKITDTGPILRLENGELNKAQRYDHPRNRPVMHSTINPNSLVKMITDYYGQMYQHTEKRQRWSWKELKVLNQQLSRQTESFS